MPIVVANGTSAELYQKLASGDMPVRCRFHKWGEAMFPLLINPRARVHQDVNCFAIAPGRNNMQRPVIEQTLDIRASRGNAGVLGDVSDSLQNFT